MNRRTLLAAASATALLGTPSIPFANPARAQRSGADVVSASGNLSFNGELPGPPLTADSAFEQLWISDVDHATPAAPVILGDSTLPIAFATTREGIAALDLWNGTSRWNAKLGQFTQTPTLVDDNLLLVTNLGESLSPGKLSAIDIESGDSRWERDADAQASPYAVEGTVLVTSEEGILHALTAQDGSERWSLPVGPEATAATHANGLAVLATSQGQVIAIRPEADPRHEAPLAWATSLDLTKLTRPAYRNESLVLCGNATSVVVLNAITGEVRWQQEQAAASISSVALSDSSIFFLDDLGQIHALSTDTGEALWSAEVPGYDFFLTSGWMPPALIGDQVLVTAPYSGLHVFQADSGEPITHIPLTNETLTMPVVVSGDYLVSTTTEWRYVAWQRTA